MITPATNNSICAIWAGAASIGQVQSQASSIGGFGSKRKPYKTTIIVFKEHL
jgi:hypothetical protein